MSDHNEAMGQAGAAAITRFRPAAHDDFSKKSVRDHWLAQIRSHLTRAQKHLGYLEDNLNNPIPGHETDELVSTDLQNLSGLAHEAYKATQTFIAGRALVAHKEALAKNPDGDGVLLHTIYYATDSTDTEGNSSIQRFLDANISPITGIEYTVESLRVADGVRHHDAFIKPKTGDSPPVIVSRGNTLCFYSSGLLVARAGDYRNLGKNAMARVKARRKAEEEKKP